MLKEARDLQNKAINDVVALLETKKEITFKSPTGSGKTYMMARIMNAVLEKTDEYIFLVSTLSKGELASQNYNAFLKYSNECKKIDPFLIETEQGEESGLFIETTHNVYILARDLYKKSGILMQGAMDTFLNNITLNHYFGGLDKKIILIKDECHQKTNNLDSLREAYFTKIINMSATPNKKMGQIPDVEILDDDAVNASLIKRIEIGDENDTVEDAIVKFEKIKNDYVNLLDVNPCLMIQISNKDKADYEFNHKIMPVLNKAEHQGLKWMLIVDNEKDCDTNDVFKSKKLPLNKWKEYAKANKSTIDIIIFKLVVSEGWDIPRACMLYQVRDTQSDQLDEQVMGRVRRNPRLMDFEELNDDAKKLATTSWIWGIMPKDIRPRYTVKLAGDGEDVNNEISLYSTILKNLIHKKEFDLDKFLSNDKLENKYLNIFQLYKRIKNANDSIKDLCYEYSTDFQKWWKFAEHIDEIEKENNNYLCNYKESLELKRDENGKPIKRGLPVISSYIDNGNYINMNDWIWNRKDGKDKFSFDSEAEREWAQILKDLCHEMNNDNLKIIKKITVGYKNPEFGKISLLDEAIPEKIKTSERFAWGKNYLTLSDIKFDYYLDGIHSSYPDFIAKDSYNRIHLFEVKSVNVSNKKQFDTKEYKDKIEALRNSYAQASKLTGYIFYLPVLKDDEWQITILKNGNQEIITKEQFVERIKSKE